MWGFEVFLPNMFMRYFVQIKEVNFPSMQESPLRKIIVAIDDFVQGAVFIMFGSILGKQSNRTRLAKKTKQKETDKMISELLLVRHDTVQFNLASCII